jgi:hypothetical protein
MHAILSAAVLAGLSFSIFGTVLKRTVLKRIKLTERMTEEVPGNLFCNSQKLG